MLLKYYHKTSFFVSYWYVSKSKKVLHQKTSKILPTTVSIKTKMMGMLHKAFVRRESDPLGTKQCGSHFVVVVLFLKNGPITVSFCLFSSFLHVKILWKQYGVHGIRTRGGRMEAADDSTQLWRQPRHTILSALNLLIDVS